MRIEHFNEPLLEFADGRHVCPRKGISTYGVFDRDFPSRNDTVNVGAVGTGVCLQKLSDWIERCRDHVPGRSDAQQPRLFPSFPGIRQDSGFFTMFYHGPTLRRQIPEQDVTELCSARHVEDRVETAVELYREHIAFLAQNRQVDVIVCVVPDRLYEVMGGGSPPQAEEATTNEETDAAAIAEENFRRALKARTMNLACPLQLVWESTFGESTPKQQDDATKAWNLWTALYYKSGAKIPWKIPRYDGSTMSSCAIGIAFYRSRDRTELRTSVAQVFDEMGNGVILRGTPVEVGKHDRTPRLTEGQAHDLVQRALGEYRIAMGNFPARVVIHKSANFVPEEVAGLTSAARECGVQMIDTLTILDSKVHLYRSGNYPPYRGTVLHLSDARHVLYTRGSVWYYQTYPGAYVPRPIEYRMVQCDSSPSSLGREILALSKLNWNNTQFDGKHPITLGCARNVGDILKYMDYDEVPQVRYAYYM